MKVLLLLNWGLGLEILKTIHQLSDIEIVAVITQHNTASNNKWKNIVYEFACKNRYEVINQKDLSFDEIYSLIKTFKVDLLISHAFMKIIPDKIFTAPTYGAINIHPSLLPKYRGPAPTYWILQNRETETGLTCHYIDQGMDTGDIIYQVGLSVGQTDTFESIVENLKKQVPKLIIESVERIKDNSFLPIAQNHKIATYAPKPKIMEGEYEKV